MITPEELQSLKQYIDNVPTEMAALEEMFKHITAGNELLLKYRYITDPNDFVTYWSTFGWPQKVTEVLEDSEFHYREFRNAFQLELRANCAKLTEDISTLSTQVEMLSRYGDEARADEYYDRGPPPNATSTNNTR